MVGRSFIQRVGLAIVLIAVMLSTSACVKCDDACVLVFQNWVKAGALGSVPAGGAAYCLVHKNNPFCL